MFEKNFYKTTTGRTMGYILYGPDAVPDKKLPVIVYLHGTDGCGDDPDSILRIESLPSYIRDGKYTPMRDFFVLAPQCPEHMHWRDVADDAVELIDHIVKEKSADAEHIALTGASLGGMGTFELALKFPFKFSCLVPVCGAVDAKLCNILTGMPVWIFHGSEDTGMGFSVVDANNVINASGGHSRLTMLPGEGHEIRHIYTDECYNVVNRMLDAAKADDEI